MHESLDQPELLHGRDSHELLGVLGRYDRQLEDALRLGQETDLYGENGDFHQILICGQGGSAIGGDLLRVFLREELRLAMTVNRNYTLPAAVDSGTLAIVCSYSGRTEEAISAFQAALNRDARILCVSTNGDLEQLARDYRKPLIRIPEGLPPRMALGHLFTSLLPVLTRLGAIRDHSEEVCASAALIRKKVQLYGPDSPMDENPAKKLAAHLFDRIPVIYGSQDRLEAVALRWRGQIAENAKQLAFGGTLPEMNHNEIVGWRHPATLNRGLVPVFLRDRDDHPRIQIRAEITSDLLSERVPLVLEFWSDGESFLERLWSLILLGDYASIYLAFLNEEDPFPIRAIEELKDRMKSFPE